MVSHEINGKPKIRYNKGDGTRSVIKGEYRRAEEHKHEKPISFLSPIIEGYSNKKFIILDLFAGGGSMFSTSHQLNRKCYGMELDPKYCDVIVKRMIALDENFRRIHIDCEYGVYEGLVFENWAQAVSYTHLFLLKTYYFRENTGETKIK